MSIERSMFVDALMSRSIYRMLGNTIPFISKWAGTVHPVLPKGDRKLEDLRLKKLDDGSQTKVRPNPILNCQSHRKRKGSGRCRSVKF